MATWEFDAPRFGANLISSNRRNVVAHCARGEKREGLILADQAPKRSSQASVDDYAMTRAASDSMGTAAAATRTTATAMVNRRKVAVGCEFGMGASCILLVSHFAGAKQDDLQMTPRHPSR